MIRRSLLLAGAALLAGASTASGAGAPVLADFLPNSHGVKALDGQIRYTARPAGRDTLVRSVAGSRVRTARLPGHLVVPIVAYDSSASGLSGDGRTLVLVNERVSFPRRSTKLAILDARSLRTRAQVGLHGDFSVDAISPTGRWLYLIQYTSRSDPTRYRVRALDTSTHRLLAHDIVDPYQRDEKMRGQPFSRVMSSDGTWAYTLYIGPGKPFVHALNTAGLTARCIDLPAFAANTNPYNTRLQLVSGGHSLRVIVDRHEVALVDTRTFRVQRPALGAPHRPSTVAPRQGGGSLSTGLVIVAAFALIGVVTVLLRRRLAPLSRPAR